MNNVLTLPPYVRGKVAGYLKLSVEEIQITKRIFHLNNGSSLVTQVQWWGEALPIFLRPENVRLINQNGNEQLMSSLQESTTYEIRTNVDLFRSYLKNCESLELVVHEETKNIVVGSAFFHNLHRIVENNNGSNDVVLPLVDYQGDIIGELKFHLNLSKNFLKQEVRNHRAAAEHVTSQSTTNGNVSDYELLSTPNNYQNKPGAQILGMPNMVVDICEFDRKSNFIKTSSKFFRNCQNNKKQISECSNSSNDKKKTICSSCENNQTCQLDENRECSTKQLPLIQTEDDFSKVISIDLTWSKPSQGQNASVKKPLPRDTCRRANLKTPAHPPKVVSSLAKSKFKKPIHELNRKINMKQNKFQMKESPLENRSKQIDDSVLNVVCSSNGKTKETSMMEVSPSECVKYNSPEMATMSANVMDYLFGCEMSKEDEEKALSSLLNMSPCHHLVKNITKLYSNSPVKFSSSGRSFGFYDSGHWPKGNSFKRSYRNYPETNSEITHRGLVNNLKYNFNNPIERKYYAKFFGNHENSHAFQVAQILNKPERDLDGAEAVRIEIFESKSKNDTDENISLCHREPSDSESIMELKGKNANDEMNHQKENKSINDCCQYYKKLNELDKIIESLNDYERKIVTEEKLSNVISTC